MIACALVALSSGACRETREPPLTTEPVNVTVGAGGSAGAGGAQSTDAAPAFRMATWNLHNFSSYGVDEFRIDDIAGKIQELDADVLAVQELRVTEGAMGPQAWDVLLETLEGYEGLHNPWNLYDTTVGLLYKSDRATVLSSRSLFDDDSYAFPRPPLEVALEVTEGDASIEVTVIVLHLKAFADAVDRRRAACTKLASYLEEQPSPFVVMLGDLNDDPYDAPSDNAFAGTFLDAEPRYHFLTHALPPESVTSLGYYHYVGDTKIDGEFLDHIIVTGPVADTYAVLSPTIHGLPPAEYAAWEYDYSDHFPVTLDLAP